MSWDDPIMFTPIEPGKPRSEASLSQDYGAAMGHNRHIEHLKSLPPIGRNSDIQVVKFDPSASENAWDNDDDGLIIMSVDKFYDRLAKGVYFEKYSD